MRPFESREMIEVDERNGVSLLVPRCFGACDVVIIFEYFFVRQFYFCETKDKDPLQCSNAEQGSSNSL